MTRFLFAVALLLAPLSARAADAADPDYHYYKLAGKARWEGEAVGRQGITLNADLPSAYEFCMVPPVGDWALESKDAKIEEQYLRLIDRVAVSDGMLGGDGDGTGGAWIAACGSVKRFGQIADFQRMDSVYLKTCKSEDRIKEAHKYACVNHRLTTTGFVFVDSLKALLVSEHPETVKRALMVARETKRADKLFGPIVAKVALDASRPEDVRAAAAETLGTLVPTELSGKTIASLWLDDKLKPETRIAAMNAFAFVVSYGDMHGGGVSTALKAYLPQLKGINQEHLDETSGKPDAVGAAAYCAGKAYPKAIQDEFKFK